MRAPRPISAILAEFVAGREQPAVATTTQAEAELLARLGKHVKRNRLWSLGTEDEQLSLGLPPEKAS